MFGLEIVNIDAIYVLDPSGIPLFARYYRGDINKTDSTLLGGFFSAIEIFVKTSLDGLLTDIGMTDTRFFFDRTDSEYIIIIIVRNSGDNSIEKSTIDLISHLQKIINLCFSVVKSTALNNMIDVQILAENLGTSIDSFLLETAFEFVEPELGSDGSYVSIKSESLSNDELDLIIDQIKSNR